MSSFSRRFWSSAQSKFRKWKKAEAPTDKKQLQRIENAKRATQSFVCLSTIATGLLTIIAFSHSRDIWKRYPGWVKTLRSNIPSLAVVKETLVADFHDVLPLLKNLPAFYIIFSLRRSLASLYFDVA